MGTITYLLVLKPVTLNWLGQVGENGREYFYYYLAMTRLIKPEMGNSIGIYFMLLNSRKEIRKTIASIRILPI